MAILGDYIELVDIRNADKRFGVNSLKGISIDKKLTPTKANVNSLDVKGYKILRKNWFAYSPVTSRNGNKISIAINDGEDCIISAINPVFRIKDESILEPNYIMMLFRRPEFDRYARFHSWGSARETFDWDELCDVRIPLPSYEAQKSIVAIANSMAQRKKYSDKISSLLSDICPILIRGSLLEAQGGSPNAD